jgi:hypothetical protein
VIASATLRKRALEPQLDAIAIGHHEGLVFYNPSPEPDSIFELVSKVVQPGASAREFGRLLVKAHKLNGEQGELEKAVCGVIDRLAVDLADLEFNDPVRRAIGSRSLAQGLRPHLKQISQADGVDSTAILAIRQVEKLTAGIVRMQILSPALERELGQKLFAILTTIVGEAAPR